MKGINGGVFPGAHSPAEHRLISLRLSVGTHETHKLLYKYFLSHFKLYSDRTTEQLLQANVRA
jgi:hypothetical protein